MSKGRAELAKDVNGEIWKINRHISKVLSIFQISPFTAMYHLSELKNVMLVEHWRPTVYFIVKVNNVTSTTRTITEYQLLDAPSVNISQMGHILSKILYLSHRGLHSQIFDILLATAIRSIY